MSQKKSKKQLQKKKERERRVYKNRDSISTLRLQKEYERNVKRLVPFPEFRVDKTDATDDIVDLVESGLEKFRHTYARELNKETLCLIEHHIRNGWTDLVNDRASVIKELTRDRVERSIAQLMEISLGDGILRGSKPHLRRRALPTNCFTLRPGEKHWDIKCRSLRTVQTPNGILYQSPHRPTITIDGKIYEVAFTRHALGQLTDRVIPGWNDHYIGQTYAFGFLYECVYFGLTKMLNGQTAFIVYNSCLRAGAQLMEFMKELLNVKTREDLQSYYYRVGYCPITFDGDLATAKTFLTPGYWHTPERRLLAIRTKSSRIEVMRDIEQASDDGINIISVTKCKKTRAAINWFHKHGVPQVEKIESEVFRDAAGPYAWSMRVEDKSEEQTIPEASS